MQMTIKTLVFGLCALTFSGNSLVLAQKVAIDAAVRMSDKPYVQVAGQATVSAKPDQVVVEIGVVTQGPTAIGVAAENAKQTDTVIAVTRYGLNTSK